MLVAMITTTPWMTCIVEFTRCCPKRTVHWLILSITNNNYHTVCTSISHYSRFLINSFLQFRPFFHTFIKKFTNTISSFTKFLLFLILHLISSVKITTIHLHKMIYTRCITFIWCLKCITHLKLIHILYPLMSTIYRLYCLRILFFSILF
jgi:hypothetical protein